MHIEVQPYNPEWPMNFSQTKGQLENTLSGVAYIAIEHVGSTSVPGLAAKPVIDVTIIVQRNQLAAVIDALQKGRFHYFGEQGIPDRHAFVKPDIEIKSRVYAAVEHSQGLRNHLLLRDVCRSNEEARTRYGQLKLNLSRRDWKNMDEYTDAKSDVISWILSIGGMDQEDISGIRVLNKSPMKDSSQSKHTPEGPKIFSMVRENMENVEHGRDILRKTLPLSEPTNARVCDDFHTYTGEEEKSSPISTC